MGYCFVRLNEINHSYKQMIPEYSLMSNHKAPGKIHTHTHTHTVAIISINKSKQKRIEIFGSKTQSTFVDITDTG